MNAYVVYSGMCLCVMGEKKEKTAYLEYMVEKNFSNIIKLNTF